MNILDTLGNTDFRPNPATIQSSETILQATKKLLGVDRAFCDVDEASYLPEVKTTTVQNPSKRVKAKKKNKAQRQARAKHRRSG